MTRIARAKRVALAFPVTLSWAAAMADGVAEYARRQGGWDFTTSPPTLLQAEELALTVYSLRDWPGDGVIAVFGDAAESRAARRLKVPVVSVGGSLKDCGLPQVRVDTYAVGQMAAEHLLVIGLRRLAFYGLRGAWYSQERRRGFVDRALKAGASCEVFEAPALTNPRASWQQRRAAVGQWLKSLVLPVGVLAVHDYRARVLIDECVRLGLDVPHDVAVLGVGNDLTACEFCQPSLSSVSPAARQIGYEAAALLDRLMAGQPAPQRILLIPPDGVVPRRSTDTMAVDDPNVSAAVHYMQDHLGEVFGIERVMKQVAVSRRRLHDQFQRLLNYTPYEYLCRLRVQRAKLLLAAPGHVKLRTVAVACGFSSPARFRLVFQRLTGVTPAQYHRQHRGPAKSKPSKRQKG
jgi:LacI family transcriptional regulator